MWFFSRKNRREPKAHTPRPRFRLQVETLEDRCVPTVGWLTTSSVVGADPIMDLAQDSVGNTFATGYFSGTMTLGSTILTSDGTADDLFVAKLDPTGSVLWAQRFGSTGIDRGLGIDVASDGTAYVSGTFSGTVAIGSTTMVSAGGSDVLVFKLDSDGNPLWARQAGSSGPNQGYPEESRSVAIASDGSAYISGHFQGTANFGSTSLSSAGGMDQFLAKMSNMGDFLWARQLGSAADDFGRDVFIGANGDAFISGSQVARYDPDGNLIWNRTLPGNPAYGTNGENTGGAMYQDSATGVEYLYVADVYNDLVRKLDAGTGTTVWEQATGTTDGRATGIAADAMGNVYVTGASGGLNDFDPGPGTFYLSNSAGTNTNGGYDIYLLKLDSGGNFVSARNMGAANGASDFAYDVEVDAAGNVFLSGTWGGAASFDLGDTTTVRTSPYLQDQGFILKMTQGLGAISGRVFADADNNGIQGTDEPPLAGATVYLDQNGNESLDAGEVSVTTDAFGGYLFPHLAAGTHNVRQVLPAGWTSSAPTGGVTVAADQFVGHDLGAYSVSMTATYTNTMTLNIQDLKTVTSNIVVSGGTTFIYDVDVQINISHANDADLNVYLIAPDGTRIELTTDNGGTGNNYTNTIFDDQAAVSITAGAAPFTGRYRPEGTPGVGMLSALNGKSANGIWTLEIYDDARKNTGTLLNWSLTIKGASAQGETVPLPKLSIDSVSKAEGKTGTTAFTFTVTLSAASTDTVTVNYATVNGSASATDYTSQTGTLTFAPGETTKTITIFVKGDKQKEADETFFVNLTDALNADILDGQGLGTILNDD